MREYHPPVLDLADIVKVVGEPEFSPGWRALTQQFDSAMRSNGILYLENTGVPHDLIPTLRTSSLKYFVSSPLPKGGKEEYGPEGYTPVGTESVSNSAVDSACDKQDKKKKKTRDIVESLVLQSPDSGACPGEMRTVISDYMAHAERLMQLMLRLMASAVRVAPEVLLEPFRAPNNALKLSHYPAKYDGTQGYGAHTDFSGFTILSQDDSDAFPSQGALQLLLGDNTWATIPPVKNMLLVNAGELISHWTNGAYKSPVHRVVLAPHRTDSRVSIIYFTAPNDDTVVQPLSSCCDARNPPMYEPVIAGDWIKHKLKLTNG